MTDPMVLMMYGGDTGGMGDPFEDDDDMQGGGNSSVPMPKDTIETQLLLGDRKSQEIGELFTINLFKMLEKANAKGKEVLSTS